jgi:hypothetical protein
VKGTTPQRGQTTCPSTPRALTARTLATRTLAGGAAIGALALGGGMAQADTAAQATGDATGSPGVLSGNSVQVPINAPINICGNTINVLGLLNVPLGASCANSTGSTATRPPTSRPVHYGQPPAPTGTARGGQPSQAGQPGGSSSRNGAQATGDATGSPGVLSGNGVQVPINAPINICGNTIDILSGLNGVSGAGCANGTPVTSVQPPPPPPRRPVPPPPRRPVPPPPPPRQAAPPPRQQTPSVGAAPLAATAALAHTGADGMFLIPVAAGLIGGGLALRRQALRRSRG